MESTHLLIALHVLTEDMNFFTITYMMATNGFITTLTASSDRKSDSLFCHARAPKFTWWAYILRDTYKHTHEVWNKCTDIFKRKAWKKSRKNFYPLVRWKTKKLSRILIFYKQWVWDHLRNTLTLRMSPIFTGHTELCCMVEKDMWYYTIKSFNAKEGQW